MTDDIREERLPLEALPGEGELVSAESDEQFEADDSAQDPSTVAVDDTDADEAPYVPRESSQGTAVPQGMVRYSQVQLKRAREALTRIYAIRRAARFYPMDHPAVTEGIGMLLNSVGTYHAEGVELHLGFFEGEILLGEQLLTEESILFDQLVRDMTGMGIGSIVIRRGVEHLELTRLMQLVIADAGDIERAGGLGPFVSGLKLPHVDVGAVRAVERTDGQLVGAVEDARAAYGGAVSLLREIDRLMRVNRHMSAGRAKGVVKSLVDNVLSSRYAMLQLTGLKNYDEYTFYHSANVAILSLALGSMITSDYRFLSSLGVGALLHDIGKLSVDLEILNKPGALTPEEWANVREHPVRGAQMVSLLPGVDKASLVTILEHHMRFDNTGYPVCTPQRPQHLASRIIAVADSYDAMTSRRSYSAARVQDQAMTLIAAGAGNSLDPVLVRLFIRLMGVYPPRSVVRLSQGQVAVVLSPSPTDPLRPIVRIIAAESGELIEPIDLDLTTTPDISVRGCIDGRLLNIDVDAYL